MAQSGRDICSSWTNGEKDENSLSDFLALEERNELIKFSSPGQLAMQLISFPVFKNSILLQNLGHMHNFAIRQRLKPISCLLHFEVFLSMSLLTIWWCFYCSSYIFLHNSQWKWWHGNGVPCHTDYRCSLSSAKQLPAVRVWEVAYLSRRSKSSRSLLLVFLWRWHYLCYAWDLKNKSSFKTWSFN